VQYRCRGSIYIYIYIYIYIDAPYHDSREIAAEVIRGGRTPARTPQARTRTGLDARPGVEARADRPSLHDHSATDSAQVPWQPATMTVNLPPPLSLSSAGPDPADEREGWGGGGQHMRAAPRCKQAHAPRHPNRRHASDGDLPRRGPPRPGGRRPARRGPAGPHGPGPRRLTGPGPVQRARAALQLLVGAAASCRAGPASADDRAAGRPPGPRECQRISAQGRARR
jgi:hypothetical protein